MSEILEKPEVQKIYIDARGPRFSASLTTIVLATTLVTHNVWVLVAQGLVFLIGATVGPQFTPSTINCASTGVLRLTRAKAIGPNS